MIRYQRPPSAIDGAENIAKARRAVAEAIRDGRAPEFPAHWQDHRGVFLKAQHGKCAWCETKILNQYAPIDHYAPKGGVDHLVGKRWELDGDTGSRSTHGAYQKVHTTGYWFLAYTWENWLAVCAYCNTGWKRNLFPVRESPYPLPAPDIHFTPLLLNPLAPPDPEDHLDFDELGQIAPRNGSERGRATIEVCGLSRETLRGERARVAEQVAQLTRRYLVALELQGVDNLEEVLQDLYRHGAPDAVHAGVARSLVRRALGLTWDDILELRTLSAER